MLLTGDEPLKHTELLELAGKKSELLFPIFTAATPDAQALKLLDRCRNLVPVVDVSEAGTQALDTMDMLTKKNILFGAFAAVKEDNLSAVCADARVTAIAKRNCKGLLYLDGLSGEAEKAELAKNISRLRTAYPELLFFSMAGESFGGTVLHDTKAELEAFVR